MNSQAPKPSNPKPSRSFNNIVRYSNIAFQMIVIVVAGTFGGKFLDSKLNWSFPVLTLVGALGSVAIAMYLAMRDFLKKK